MLAAPAPAQTQKAERPVVRPGDRWRFETRVDGKPVAWLGREWVVKSVNPMEIDGTENGKPLALTPNLNMLDSPTRTDTDRRLLAFPLQVGERWRFSDDFTLTSVDIPSHGDFRVGVVAYEKVRVAAGDFDAFRLVAKGRWTAGDLHGETTLTYWYAPDARAIVRIHAQDTVWGSRTSELVEYHLQP